MQNITKHKKKEYFFQIYLKAKKIHEQVFIDDQNLKIYWFGVACLPLIYYVTINLYLLKKKTLIAKKMKLFYEKKILFDTYETNSLKKFLYKIKVFVFKNIFFNSKKIYVIFSKNAFTNNYCNKKKLFQIKINPLWSLTKNEINNQACDKYFIKKIDKFIHKLHETFQLNKKSKNSKNSLKNIKKKFIFYYKIYLLFIIKTQTSVNYSYITSYTGIIFVRLFLSSLRFNKNNRVYTHTHGEVEVLNQLPSLINDPALLGNFLIIKGKHYRKKYTNFFNSINKNYIKPKFISFVNKSELRLIKENYSFKRNNKKKFLVVGYPHSSHYDLNVPHIIPNDYHKVEIQIMKKLSSLGYDVTYKIHPDRIKKNINLFEKKFKVLTAPYEQVEKNFDYSLFTYHRSTALGNAMKNNSSILVLSFDRLDMDQYTYEILKKRISFVNLNSKKNLTDKNNIYLKHKINKSKKLINYNSIKKMLL